MGWSRCIPGSIDPKALTLARGVQGENGWDFLLPQKYRGSRKNVTIFFGGNKLDEKHVAGNFAGFLL